MISSPELGLNINDPRYKFVIDCMEKFDSLITDPAFPDNDWKNYLDIDSFVDYILLNEVVLNYELDHPKSVFMCKRGDKTGMSHLWDFDWAFGTHHGGMLIEMASAKWEFTGGHIFSLFFKDKEFTARYKARWAEKYEELLSMTDFMTATAEKLLEPMKRDYDRWYKGTENQFNYVKEITNLISWWDTRVRFLNTVISKR